MDVFCTKFNAWRIFYAHSYNDGEQQTANSKQHEEDDVLINEQKKDPSAHLAVIEQDVAEGLNAI